jgi:hypothetical protein
MDFRDSQDWLELYAANRPDPDLPPCEAFQSELDGSQDLQEKLRSVAVADEQISRVLRDVSPPPGLRERILEKLAEQRTTRRLERRRWIVSTSLAAAACLALTVGWMLYPAPRWTSDAVVARAIELWDQPDLRTQQSDWGDGHDWPTGFRVDASTGCILVDFLGVQARLYQFNANGQWAQVIVVPASRLAMPIDGPVEFYPESPGDLKVVLFSTGDCVAVAVIQSKLDLTAFMEAKALT